MREQIAEHGRPRTRRKSRYAATTTETVEQSGQQQYTRGDAAEASTHRAGHYSGIHPEDVPRTTAPYQQATPLVSRPEQQRHPVTTRADIPRVQVPYDEDEDDEYLYQQRLPSSTRRYDRHAIPNRTSAVQAYRQDTRGVAAQQQRPQPRQYHPFVTIGVIALCLVIGALFALIIPPQWQRLKDQMAYGYPRTFQTDANVGHGGTSHFIVVNNHGTIEVTEIGSVDKPQPKLYIVSTLTGPNADLFPVIISFVDLKHNGHPSMLVAFNNTAYLYDNTGTAFTPHH